MYGIEYKVCYIFKVPQFTLSKAEVDNSRTPQTSQGCPYIFLNKKEKYLLPIIKKLKTLVKTTIIPNNIL